MNVKFWGGGFHTARTLAKKFNILYRLCETLLSKQHHYDFGLRSILSVLRMCGSRMRDEKDTHGLHDAAREGLLFLQTVRSANIGKMVTKDVPLFVEICASLFPDIDLPTGDARAELRAALQAHASQQGLDTSEAWLQTAELLSETYLVRHAIALLGSSGSGKSCLQAAYESCPPPKEWADAVGMDNPRQLRLNPKAVTARELFGWIDEATREWTDGVFSSVWRKANKSKHERTWVVLDGPIDAIWVEKSCSCAQPHLPTTRAHKEGSILFLAHAASIRSSMTTEYSRWRTTTGFR
jgi:dynein heavy chain